MICQKCNRQIPDDSRFCPECGAKVEQEENKICSGCGSLIPADSRFCPNCNTEQVGINAPKKIRAAVPVKRVQPQRTQTMELTPEEQEKRRKRTRMIGIGAGTVVGICLIAGIASIFIKPSINLNKYVSITTEGYDTIGKASAEFDTDRFVKDYGKKLRSKAVSDEEIAANRFLMGCVDGRLNLTEGLSNGDIVTFAWECNDDYALEEYGYKLKYSDIDLPVEGLKEAETFDPFEGITVVYEGISPKGTAVIAGDPVEPGTESFRYELDQRNNLANGDTVTLSAIFTRGGDPAEYCIERYGAYPEMMSKAFVVSGLGSYVSSLAEITDETLASMQAQAKDVYLAYAAKNWGEGEELSGMEYLGSYLLVNKDSEAFRGRENLLFLVYRVNIHNSFTNSQNETYDTINSVYWYISFENLIGNADGSTTVNVTDYDTPNNRIQIDSGLRSGWSSKIWRYYGYGSLDELTRDVVTANAETYRCEDEVGQGMASVPQSGENTITATTAPSTEDTAAGTTVEAGEDGFIFPDSGSVVISAADAAGLTDEELRYAINEIYARHGYIFNDDALRAYYSQYGWYQAAVAPGSFSENVLTEAERENIKVLQNERDKR